MDPMTLDPWQLFGAVVTVMGLAGGVEIGLAFLMRGQREASGFDDR